MSAWEGITNTIVFIIWSMGWIVIILTLVTLPIFLSGMFVAILGTLGHIVFIVLFSVAVIFYIKNFFNILVPFKVNLSTNKNKNSGSTKKTNGTTSNSPNKSSTSQKTNTIFSTSNDLFTYYN